MGAQESSGRRQQQLIDIKENVPHDAKAYKLWAHIHQAVKNRTQHCTIFINKFGKNDDSIKYYENGIKLLKQLKHPCILKFLDGACTTSDISLITERVQMLDHAIKSLPVAEIQSGLHHILGALLFLHTKASLSHNNLSPASIFVASNGEWKLGGFEFSCPPHLVREFLQSSFYTSVRFWDYQPPEDAKDSSPTTSSFSDDAYSFGKLIEFVLSSHEKEDEIVHSLLEIAAQLTAEDPSQRILLSSLVGHPALSNSLVQIIEFCNTIHLKTDEEKDEFFKDIVPRLRSIPADVVARRLSRPLLSRYVLLESRSLSELYPSLLVPAEDDDGILPTVHFKNCMVPEILRLFRVREAPVRAVLLSHFESYARFIPHERLIGFVTDEVLQGCHDSDSHLVAISLRALAYLVEILGAEAVCPWPISKIFANGSPKRPRAVVDMKSISSSHENSSSSLAGTTTEMENTVSVTVSGHNKKTWSDEENADWNNDESWSSEWKEGDEVTPSTDSKADGRPISTVTFHSPIAKTNSASEHRKTNTIGSEFEITVATRRSLEDELLADLTPNIPTTSLIDQLSSLQNSLSARSAIKKVPPKFAMVETVDDAEGWEENGDEGFTNSEDLGPKEQNEASA